MSAFHRVDDVYAMPGPRFFRLAWRLPCYRGVMRERVLAGQREDGAGRASPRPVQPEQSQAAAPESGREPVPATKAVIRSDPRLNGIFSFSGD